MRSSDPQAGNVYTLYVESRSTTPAFRDDFWNFRGDIYLAGTTTTQSSTRPKADFMAFAADSGSSASRSDAQWRSTTILTVRHNGVVAVGGDGQVTYGSTIMKADTRKIRRMLDDTVIVGFAGSTADAFALMERFETKAKDYPGNITRAATELARDWRTDRALRRLEALMVVVNDELSLLITGQGDVVQPADGIVGIGSGGPYATAAARALVVHSKLSAAEIVKQSLEIAAGIDVYTNENIIVEELKCPK